MSLHPALVGRVATDPNGKPVCINCKQPFKGGNQGEPGVNVYSQAGMREIAISGMCETCFDIVTAEPEEEDETRGYTAWCSACGGPCNVYVDEREHIRAETCEKCGGDPELEPPTDVGDDTWADRMLGRNE